MANPWAAARSNRPADNISAVSNVPANFGPRRETKASCAWKHSGAMVVGTSSSPKSVTLTHPKIEMLPAGSLNFQQVEGPIDARTDGGSIGVVDCKDKVEV